MGGAHHGCQSLAVVQSTISAGIWGATPEAIGILQFNGFKIA